MPEPLPGQLLVLASGVLLGALAVVLVFRWRDARPARAADAEPAAARRPLSVELGMAQAADLAGIGVLELDGDRVVRWANGSAHRLLGRPAGTLVGLTAIGAFLDHRVDELLERSRGGPAELELTGAGEPPSTLLIGADGRAGGWLLVARDVSRLRRLERIRTELIDNLSHELRTPLTTIRLLTETLAIDVERSDVPAKVRQRVALIDAETAHLVQIVNELLDLSRIESGATTLQLENIQPMALAGAAVERLRAFAERHEVRVVVEPPAAGTRLPPVHADADRLGQVLLNLIHNAVKFSAAGTTVTVRAAAGAGEVAFSVSDEGIGIPRADVERVFERFYKVDRARAREVGGTGLGLAIARHIVEAHGGRIWADSEEGRGSVFTFTVPVAGQPAG